MSLGINLFGHHLTILNDTQVKILEEAGHQLETVALSEVDKAVVAAKQTSLGAAATAAISAVDSKELTGPQKFEEALAAILPEVLHYVTGGGFAALEADVIDFGRHFLQSVFNDFKSTTAGKIATEVLHIVGG
jgi:hypothetical protein